MAESSNHPQLTLSQRIESIDILRGITILVMLFVNDISGVKGVPAWMQHVSADADGMTFVDVVFPAFLFIVGMAIPFSIGKRMERQDSLWEIWKHILVRTAGLLIIGVIMVNGETVSDNGIINQQMLFLMAYAGIILVWNKPHGKQSALISKLRFLGIVLVIAFVFLYRGNNATGIIQLRTQWWGILGLIGWAYLFSCIFYVWLRKNIAGLIGVIALLYGIHIAHGAGFFDNLTWIKPWINLGGSHAAIVVSGIVLGMMLKPDSHLKTHYNRIGGAVLYGLVLAVIAILLHSLNDAHKMFTINKIHATPVWCLLCSAYTIWLWAAIYWLVDVKKWKRWAIIVEPAGSNALFAYILAPIIMYSLQLIAIVFGGYNFYHTLGESFAIGFWRSFIAAFAITWLAGSLRRKGIWLKL
jgi:heparan-alpha-glucosaminide N-acetyltransferase